MHFVNVEEAELQMRKMKQWEHILQNLPGWEPFSLTGKAEKVRVTTETLCHYVLSFLRA